jgi:hypothetical protein
MYNIILPPKFVGLRNYILINNDPQVWNEDNPRPFFTNIYYIGE